MADEQATEDEVQEAAAKGGLGKWIILSVLVLVLAAGGWFGYTTFLAPADVPEAEGVVEDVERADKPALFASLHPPLVVNFKDQYGDAHFMQMTLEVMAREQSVIDAVKNHTAVIRNSLILQFSNVDYDAVSTREGKQAMLDEALAEIQTIVETETGETGVEAVYFTGLIVQ